MTITIGAEKKHSINFKDSYSLKKLLAKSE